MADHIEDALIREVDEDLREEQMMKLWQRYGGFVVGIAVVIVAVVAGYQGWKHYDISTRTSESERFVAAQQLVQDGKTTEAQAALQQLAADASSGYGVMAKFQEAALLKQQGDVQGASARYQEIARDTIGNVALSGLANILSIMTEIDAGDYDVSAIEFRLSNLAEEDHPYRHSAHELQGLVALKAGDREKAHTIFEQLSKDKTAPQALRERAVKMAQSLGS